MPLAVTCPERLFDVCLNLVSENIDLVESFYGFPSLVGEKIVQRALKSPRIRDLDYASQALQLFAEAFGPELLTALNVAGQHLGLNYYLDQVLICIDLVYLDLSHCGLGDNHEIFTHISKLKSLESLYLRNNNISDDGMRKITLTYRMFGQGPHKLSTIELSDSKKAAVSGSESSTMADFDLGTKTWLVACRFSANLEVKGTGIKEAAVNCSEEEDSDLMNLYMIDNQTDTAGKMETGLMTGLTNSDSREVDLDKPHTKMPTVLKLCSRSTVKIGVSGNSKFPRTAHGHITKSKEKENSAKASIPNKQLTLLQCCKQADKRTRDNLVEASLQQTLKKQMLSAETSEQIITGKKGPSVTDNLAGANNLLTNKRSLSEQNKTSASETSKHTDGPTKKRRKIVITKRNFDVTSDPAVDKDIKSQETLLGEKKCVRSNKKNSLLDSLNKWI